MHAAYRGGDPGVDGAWVGGRAAAALRGRPVPRRRRGRPVARAHMKTVGNDIYSVISFLVVFL